MNPSYIKVRSLSSLHPRRTRGAPLPTSRRRSSTSVWPITTRSWNADADNTQYKQKRKQLAKQIDERNEKLKAEMIGKLKEVGNKVLGKFGMSLDNFKMVQDPATGGYSIKYEKWTVCHKHDTKRITLSAEWGSPAPPPTARG